MIEITSPFQITNTLRGVQRHRGYRRIPLGKSYFKLNNAIIYPADHKGSKSPVRISTPVSPAL